MSIRVSGPEVGGQPTTRPLIPDINNLTKLVSAEIEKKKDETANWKTLTNVLDYFPKPAEVTIEHILSHVRLLIDVLKKEQVDPFTRANLVQLDKEICRVISTHVGESIPVDQYGKTSYHRFATWIKAISRLHPIEIFTTNYDQLLEQALEENRVSYFDGFIGSRHAFFDLASIEHDTLPPRWARLWKLHGSMNWWRTAKGGHIERRHAPLSADEQQMIYPSHLKYDQSRRLPYLAMLDRLKHFLAPGRGPVVLITCGFSFADQHLNELILQCLRANPAAVTYALLFGDKAQYSEAITCGFQQPNLHLLARDGAVINTVEGGWETELQEEHPFGKFVTAQIPEGTKNPEGRIKHQLLLGDFSLFTQFLLQQADGNPSSVA